MKPDQQKLMKKGRGRLIHVSDFVEEENGRLIIRDEDSNVVKDARCITYPGSHGDAWWDHAQLLVQVNKRSQYLKRHTLTALHYLCSITHQHMHHSLQMHSARSI
jgi:hypothetical protein